MGCCQSSEEVVPDDEKKTQKKELSPKTERSEQTLDLANQERTIEGLPYTAFAQLSLLYVKGSEDIQIDDAVPLEDKFAELQKLVNISDEEFDNWKSTARWLDTKTRGGLLWEDVDRAVTDLGRESQQAKMISDVIETITRGRVRLRNVFVAMDTDWTGRLSKSEFADGIGLLQGSSESIDISDMLLLWNVLDKDGDGTISYQEFLDGLSVEDSWGVHPRRMSLSPRAIKRHEFQQRKNSAEISEQAPARVSLVDAAKELGIDLTEMAAKRIARFFHRSKALRLFENRVWQATLHTLDLEDEVEVNTVDTSEAPTEGDDNTSAPENEQPNPEQGIKAAVAELEQMVKDLMNRKLPDRAFANAIIQAVTLLHQECPNVGNIDVPPDGKLHIIGDLHGQLDDLLLIFNECGLPNERTVYLFNGDFVDRGPYGVEVLLLLYALKLLWPNCVFMNRGNHEAKRINEKYGFDEEVAIKYDMGLFRCITRSFCSLPLAHVIAGKIFVVHGGLSEEEDVTLEDYNMIDRTRQIPRRDESKPGPEGRYDRLFESAVWSDPRELRDAVMWENSKRGAGVHFGKASVKDFLQRNGLIRLVRSHEVYQPGYADHHNRLTTTVFSASNYCGTDDNEGCYLTVLPTLDVVYKQYRVARDSALYLQYEVKHALASGRTWKVSPKEDALRRIRLLIFCRKSNLLHLFQQHDRNKVGKVTVDAWVDVMKKVCCQDAPWRCLQKHLAVPEPDGQIAYIAFLERFQNVLTQRWMSEWAQKMLTHVYQRISKAVKGLHESGTAQVSYFQMCECLRESLPGISESGAYQLMLELDRNRDGYLDLDEFKAACEAYGDKDIVSVGLVDLWDMATYNPPKYTRFRKSFYYQLSQHRARVRQEKIRTLMHPPSAKPGWKDNS